MLEWTAGCIDNIHWRQLPLTTSTAFRPAFRWRGFPPVTSPARLKLTNTDTNTEKAGGDSRLQLSFIFHKIVSDFIVYLFYFPRQSQ